MLKKITAKMRNICHLLLLCCLYCTVCLVLLYGNFLKAFGIQIVVSRGNWFGCNIDSFVVIDVNISGDLIFFISCIFFVHICHKMHYWFINCIWILRTRTCFGAWAVRNPAMCICWWMCLVFGVIQPPPPPPPPLVDISVAIMVSWKPV
jgi:hypothetical protein